MICNMTSVPYEAHYQTTIVQVTVKTVMHIHVARTHRNLFYVHMYKQSMYAHRHYMHVCVFFGCTCTKQQTCMRRTYIESQVVYGCLINVCNNPARTAFTSTGVILSTKYRYTPMYMYVYVYTLMIWEGHRLGSTIDGLLQRSL